MDASHRLYLDSALTHSHAIEEGDSDRANAAHDDLIRAVKKIRSTPDRGREFLTRLLAHEDAGVSTWAATHLLVLDKDRALGVLEEIAELGGINGSTARIVLQEWKAGRLTTP